MIQHIKKELPDTFVIAGNVGTPEAVRELKMLVRMLLRSESVLVRFVSPRSRLVLVQVVGSWLLYVGVPRLRVNRLSLMEEFVLHGDIAKSIRFGASMVMIGFPLCRGTHRKSREKRLKSTVNSSKNTTVQLHYIKRGALKNVEGKRILLPAKGHLQDTFTEMEQDLQSAISYAGGRQGC